MIGAVASGLTFADAAGRIRRETAISTEVELKLAADPADLPALERALEARAANAAADKQPLVSTYFDTPDRALHRVGTILRVRRQGEQFIQTVKTAPEEPTNLLARGEWEDPVAANRPDPGANKSGPHLPAAVADDVRPLFISDIERVAIDIEPKPGTRIEAAIDHGAIRTADGHRSEQLSEIELELKEGDPAALYDLALELLETAPLRIDLRSKAERGYGLSDGAPGTPDAVSAEPVILTPDLTVEDALQRVGRACLAHMLRNEPAALAGRCEGIHQMRVAIRRLRSMLSSIKKMLPEADRRWVSDELKVLIEPLGPARNLDVFAAELLLPARNEAPDQPGWDELADQTEAARREAHRRVAEQLRSPRHTASVLRLLRWFEACGWRRSAAGGPKGALGVAIGTVAPAVLDRRRRAVRRRSRHFRQLPAHLRHQLRIAVKKLRYGIELLDSLYDRHDARPFIKRLKQVQDELGHANDVRVAYSLVIDLARSAPQAEAMADAGAQMLARHERSLALGEKKLRRRLKRLNGAQPFWHG
jgi:triphosphatase